MLIVMRDSSARELGQISYNFIRLMDGWTKNVEKSFEIFRHDIPIGNFFVTLAL